jgi:hypothetical protein
MSCVLLAAASLLACSGSAVRRDGGNGGFTGHPVDSGGGGTGGRDGGAGGGGGRAGGGDAGVVDGGDATDATVVEGGACSAVIENHPDEGATHIPCTTATSYATSPPSSGNHYCVWADYRTYTAPIPWGHLVHALEHGAVVIVYNCPGGCPDEVTQAQVFIDNLPVDPLCAGTDERRVILAPDPTLDVRWAASAWTWTLRAPCFDQAGFATFLRDHYGHGREATCAEWNVDPSQYCSNPPLCTP